MQVIEVLKSVMAERMLTLYTTAKRHEELVSPTNPNGWDMPTRVLLVEGQVQLNYQCTNASVQELINALKDLTSVVQTVTAAAKDQAACINILRAVLHASQEQVAALHARLSALEAEVKQLKDREDATKT
jgi:polyhydroxyalkanoate synthesis regulator phasin